MINDEEEARAYCAARADRDALLKLECLVDLLQIENQRQNLVAGGTLGEVWRRHIADSVQLLEHVPRETGQWLDLGSGGGFPGIIIAIVRPSICIRLVESRKLRIEWLCRAAEHLSLSNVRVVGQRLEVMSGNPADVISARAFAPLGRLISQSARFSTPHTYRVLPKGRSAAQELEEQSPAWRRMFHVERPLTHREAGILVGQGVPRLP